MTIKDTLKHLDLFSGIGGFSLAAQWSGIQTVAFCEIDPFCQKVLAKNFAGVPIHGDIKTFTPDYSIDLLTAGFPCQPFSVAGKQKGKEDDRYLWPEVIRLIRSCKPAWVILENVPGIIPHVDPVLSSLEEQGYSWRAYLIPASAVSAPHKRERIWIIAHANRDKRDQGTTYHETLSQRFEWPQFAAKIRDVISDTFGESITQTDQGVGTQRSEWQPRDTNTSEHWTARPIPDWETDKFPVPGVDDGVPNRMDRNKSLGNAIVPQIPYLFMKMIMAIKGR